MTPGSGHFRPKGQTCTDLVEVLNGATHQIHVLVSDKKMFKVFISRIFYLAHIDCRQENVLSFHSENLILAQLT